MPYSLPAGAFIAAALVLVPLPSHWRARNAATLSLIAWLFVVDLIYGINTTVWANNAEVRIVVWCDITTKVIIGASSALPAATTCICKHLELVASGRVVRLTNDDRRRKMMFDLVMCFGIPMILMALHYVVQGHRFDIVEDIGCQPATYYSIPAVFIVWFPPLLLSTITLVYASIALFHFFRRRITFSAHLRNSGSALTTSRYLRLIAMSITEILWGTSLTALAMYDNISPGLRPWTTWDDVHSNFSRIGQYALVQFPPNYLRQVFLFEWAIPASSFIFFLFFAFGEESMKDYRKVVGWIRSQVFRQSNKDRSDIPPLSQPRRVAISTFSTMNDSSECQFKNVRTLSSWSLHPNEKSLPATPSKTEMGSTSNDTLTLTEIGHDDLPTKSPSKISTAVSSLDPTHHITISDTYPASRPPTPPLCADISLPAPAYHRPFSPPTVYPTESVNMSQHSSDNLMVFVNTEVAHMV